MDIKLRTVGHSLTATIPNEIVRMLHLSAGDIFSVTQKSGSILMEPRKKALRGESYLEEFFSKPMDEIGMYDTEVVDTGGPVGGEIW